ncbi:SRPBCC family protein [Jatrophihabitans endophyticus]|uniref:SRPBCC family protein n=1 Tax=Jatrophihabitans endophyticus TaxID=1206085 RepID=UPI0019EF42D4|nr:SRPBCC family protein [Jatrophihabitans endophyticus]MBE7188717.1 SRPBCC family protein [Jatrophihabitans endophyticus]
MSELEFSDSVLIARPPEAVYDLVSDVTRTGEWSPICRACWWEDDTGPQVGAWFGGRNETPDRTWETRSQVVAAEPGREFAWAVGGRWTRWGYTLEAVDGGTRLTESWAFLPEGRERFVELYGDGAQAQIDERTRAARTGIPTTLAAIKAIAEQES